MQKSSKLETAAIKAVLDWKHQLFNEMTAMSKTLVKTRKSKDTITRKHYNRWFESFIDEETGDIIDVERYTLVMVTKHVNSIETYCKIYDNQGKEIKLNI